MNRKGMISLALLIVELGAAFFIFQGDMMPILQWWLMMLVLGLGAYPLCSVLFASFTDRGYAFGKILGGLAAAWVVWLLCSLRLMSFSTATVVVITLLVLAAVWLLFAFVFKRDVTQLVKEFPLDDILLRELLFTTAFLLFCHIKCCNPDAWGTERMMDYGFMQSIYRSRYFPPEDFWFAGESLNYYYFGQYFCTFLTKLSFNSVAYGYNLALAMCFAICFIFAFSLLTQLRKSEIAGIFGGVVLCCSASIHYLIFNFLVPWVWDILAIPGDKPTYWYADSTRYIGYHPDVADKTAHEYPAYSFLLGDLHAHVINIFVVLTIVALLYSFIRDTRGRELKDPRLWTLSFLMGICVMENFWDFPIYFVVSGAVLLTISLRSEMNAVHVARITLIQGATVLLTAILVSLPFHLSFTAMANGIKVAETHTPIYQLAILWALPVSLLAALFIVMVKSSSGEGFRARLRSFKGDDIFVLLLGLCGVGLVLIPELIYVADIYGGDYRRFNTMFKLSYQAFILLNLMMCYVVWRFVTKPESAGQRKWGIIAGVILFLCCGYFVTATRMSAGNLLDEENIRGLRADDYLEREVPMDADAVYWARENIPDGSVVLEANGDSYTIYNRVSVITGLPTVLGWHTHEWLWHNDLAPVDERAALVQRMYVEADAALMKEYGVDYIFLGHCEYEKYDSQGMDAGRLMELGDVIYSGPMQDDGRCTCIIKL